jgi:hypothetical protein
MPMSATRGKRGGASTCAADSIVVAVIPHLDRRYRPVSRRSRAKSWVAAGLAKKILRNGMEVAERALQWAVAQSGRSGEEIRAPRDVGALLGAVHCGLACRVDVPRMAEIVNHGTGWARRPPPVCAR